MGIIGRIGSGKSTLLKLLLGLHLPESGRITLDHVDFSQIDPADLRHIFGAVPQEPVLFFGTVRDNITLGSPDASDEDLLQAVTLAGVDEFTGNHPLGLDRPVGERGLGLSGGQRQAVVLARTLVRNPRVLLLDEPTSVMDSTSESRFRERLSRWIGARGCVL
ncbi:MAG: ATP-binding cassette domain-containing protein, partial [Magnetococcus sp. WYHC-3]